MSEKEEKTENLFQKIGTNLKKEFKHRTKSNVIASYVITWAIINWKSILYILFSGDSLNTKLSSHYTQATWGTFFVPFIGVGIYLLIVPILESTINVTSNWITRPINDKIREQQYDLKIDEIADEIQIEVERNKIFEEMSNESKLERLTKSNLFLEKKVEELTVLIDSKEITINNLSNEIKELNQQSLIKPIIHSNRLLFIRLLKHPKIIDNFRILFSEKNFVSKNRILDKDAEILTDQKLIIFNDQLERYNLTELGLSFREYLRQKDDEKNKKSPT